MIKAVSNGKQIALCLYDFDESYGAFPSSATSRLVKASSHSSWTLGDATSSELFQQLLVSGCASQEDYFYARTPWSKTPDNDSSTESKALEAGECGFAYIAGLSLKDDPFTPVCVSPLEPGKLTFDREQFDGKAVIVRIDNNVVALPIDPSGHVILNGLDLFDPRQPFWHGKTPDVKWPK